MIGRSSGSVPRRDFGALRLAGLFTVAFVIDILRIERELGFVDDSVEMLHKARPMACRRITPADLL
jgi:hypothetical protein